VSKTQSAPTQSGVTELEHSHAELRGALVVAGREIRQLNFGRKNNRVLLQLRTVLRTARAVVKAASRMRIEPDNSACLEIRMVVNHFDFKFVQGVASLHNWFCGGGTGGIFSVECRINFTGGV
jgi:hypothetical protein